MAMTRIEFDRLSSIADAYANMIVLKEHGYQDLGDAKVRCPCRTMRNTIRSCYCAAYKKYWDENLTPIPDNWDYWTAPE